MQTTTTMSTASTASQPSTGGAAEIWRHISRNNLRHITPLRGATTKYAFLNSVTKSGPSVLSADAPVAANNDGVLVWPGGFGARAAVLTRAAGVIHARHGSGGAGASWTARGIGCRSRSWLKGRQVQDEDWTARFGGQI